MVLVHINLFLCSDKALKRAVGNLDAVTDIVGDFDIPRLHTESLHFFIRERNRLGRRADEARAAADIANRVPRFIREDHLYNDVTRKNLAFHFLGLAVCGNFCDLFGGYANLKNQIL